MAWCVLIDLYCIWTVDNTLQCTCRPHLQRSLPATTHLKLPECIVNRKTLLLTDQSKTLFKHHTVPSNSWSNHAKPLPDLPSYTCGRKSDPWRYRQNIFIVEWPFRRSKHFWGPENYEQLNDVKYENYDDDSDENEVDKISGNCEDDW